MPPPIRFSLEEALEYIQEDELVEVTRNRCVSGRFCLTKQQEKGKAVGLLKNCYICSPILQCVSNMERVTDSIKVPFKRVVQW